MGEVFLAEDTSLGRKVAVKFLSSDKAADLESRKRFVHEARAQAMLSHPNIATFHEVGEEGENVFIVMEYIEGQPLSRLVSAEKLSLPEILDLAIQVGEGLQAAHEKGVVHRDIKPENVLVTSKHHAKITDFGLAKWKGASTLTQTGARMGTAYYMSPEQVEGKKVDYRTDIFSFGIVLYELFCARRPFEGDTDTAVFYDLLNTQPQPLARYSRNLPDKLEQIVFKCLAKKPEERYQHADELVAELKTLRRASEIQNAPISIIRPANSRRKLISVSIGAGIILVGVGAYLFLPRFFTVSTRDAGSSRKMLAVLPFRNLGAPEQEYFADGITNEITASLAKVSGLGVISNTSAIQYKGSKKTLGQIGEELGAQYVLEGTIQLQAVSRGESRVRITPQLIRVSDDTHLWAETYDRVFDKIFELQSDISKQIALAMDVTLLEPERKSLQSRPTENLAAYDYYLKGNEYSDRSNEERDGRIAVEMYEKAVELDPRFALAYARLSMAHSHLYWFHYDRTNERLDDARWTADKALQLTPDLPEAHLALGYYQYYGRLDYDRALEEFGLAQKNRPNNSELLAAIGYVQRRQGKFEQSLANLKKALELDPRSHLLAWELGQMCLELRRYPEAEQYLNTSISLSPDWASPYAGRAQLYLMWKGDAEKAREALREGVEKSGLAAFMSALPIGRTVFFRIPGGYYLDELDRLSAEAFGSDTSGYFLFKARLSGLLNRPEQQVVYYDSARRILESKVKAQPLEYLFHNLLGNAYAGLGRKEEAIREGKKAVELRPLTKDAFGIGPGQLANLARIYVMVGEYDAAIDQLEYLLSIPSGISVPLLRVDAFWAPLRNHPRFKKLVGT